MKRLRCNVGEYGILVNSRGEFLILRLPLNKEFTKELWMLPGGRLDYGDQAEEGLKREIMEETGLKAKVISPVYVARWGIENPQKYSTFFLCKALSDDNVKISNEHTESKWIDFRDIEKISWLNDHQKIAAKKSKILLEKGF